MITGAVLLAGLAGFLFVGPSARSVLRRRIVVAAEDPPAPSSVRRGGRTVLLAALGLLAPVLLWITRGPAGFWLSLPVLISAGTVCHLVLRSLRRRQRWENRRRVAQACSVLAAQVRIGQVPTVALRSAAQDCPVLRPALAEADLGGDVGSRWHQQAVTPGMAGLADLARAWQLAVRTGAAMGDALDDVAESLREDEDLRLTIGSEAAGPRTSGKIMAALPVVGLALGYAIGGDPVSFLIGSPYGWACLIGGSLLACSGVLWMERVADSATAEG